ncbi:MAG: FtsX-like permease family protein [Candidatus Saccharimonadales bacterium]
MNFSDSLLLATSKLKIRKRRTIATIITASVLFGVVIAAFMVIFGLKTGIEDTARSQFGNKVYINTTKDVFPLNEQSVLTRAVQLFNSSADPDKEYPLVTVDAQGNPVDEAYLDTSNVFAMVAISEYKQSAKQQFETDTKSRIDGYDAALSSIYEYVIRGDTINIGDNYMVDNSGYTIAFIDSSFTKELIEVEDFDESAIPVIMSAENASQIFDFELPARTRPSQDQLEEYMQNLKNKALGQIYEATISSENGATTAKYQIVGITAPLRSMALAKSVGEVQVLDLIMAKLGGNALPLVIADPYSQTFIENYMLASGTETTTIDLMIEFEHEDEAAEYYEQYSCDASAVSNCSSVTIIEFANNHMFIRKAFDDADKLLIIFAVFFSIVAAIIMIATVSKVIDDESRSIALYRAEGASTKNILQVYVAYVVILSLMICAAALAVGLLLGGIATLFNSSIVTSAVRVFYNIQSDIYIPLIGFDPRIWLILAAIVVIALLSLVLVSDKIKIKNIARSLKSQ